MDTCLVKCYKLCFVKLFKIILLKNNNFFSSAVASLEIGSSRTLTRLQKMFVSLTIEDKSFFNRLCVCVAECMVTTSLSYEEAG